MQLTPAGVVWLHLNVVADFYTNGGVYRKNAVDFRKNNADSLLSTNRGKMRIACAFKKRTLLGYATTRQLLLLLKCK